MTLINPFVTSGYAGAEYFCDRVQETKDITDWLRNGNNLALISPRRYGKTDLIRHCFAQEEMKDRYYTFIIDIYSTKSLLEMVNKMGEPYLKP
jgi:AAA+ ATPase superfamily predicted ATPase